MDPQITWNPLALSSCWSVNGMAEQKHRSLKSVQKFLQKLISTAGPSDWATDAAACMAGVIYTRQKNGATGFTEHKSSRYNI